MKMWLSAMSWILGFRMRFMSFICRYYIT